MTFASCQIRLAPLLGEKKLKAIFTVVFQYLYIQLTGTVIGNKKYRNHSLVTTNIHQWNKRIKSVLPATDALLQLHIWHEAQFAQC